jgi:hypothetical protein
MAGASFDAVPHVQRFGGGCFLADDGEFIFGTLVELSLQLSYVGVATNIYRERMIRGGLRFVGHSSACSVNDAIVQKTVE